jgi:glutamine---fructose-6-phosphate transaminase (isomerizing)
MSRLLEDIHRQPGALTECLSVLLGSQRAALEEAAGLARRARRIHVAGIGSSWNAGLAVVSAFGRYSFPAVLADASELLEYGRLGEGDVLLLLSRSGRSAEIVGLLDRFEHEAVQTIAVTNGPDSPLARRADAVIHLHSRFDHLVSVTMYSGLALAGSLLASAAAGTLDDSIPDRLAGALAAASSRLEGWRQRIAGSLWLDADAFGYYFLGRGPSLASCHEARLLWEEAAKAPATAMTTGGFRHGSQETIRPGLRAGIWVQPKVQREADLLLAGELRCLGASVFAIGQGLPDTAADLVVDLPGTPAGWEFLIDVIPAQLAAERLAFLRSEDCDSFRYCPYIVEQDVGLQKRS